MKNFELSYEGNHIVAYNKILFETFPLTLFDPEYLKSNSFLRSDDIETHGGRGGVHCFEYNDKSLVLRHYRRGGLPAKFVKDQYFWRGLEQTRVIQELRVLSDLSEKNLPVPTPMAAHVYKQGRFYSADIITGLIPNTKALSSILESKVVSDSCWMKIGEIIKKFHNSNCNHADLNAHNILLDNQENVFLVDFDRSKVDVSRNQWRTKNLGRLQRSLEKLANKSTMFNYIPDNFLHLMQGYTKDN